MVKIEEVKIGQVLMTFEPDPLYMEEERPRVKILFGPITGAVDGLIALQVKKERRIFRPEKLWILPWENSDAEETNEDVQKFLMAVAEGRVGSMRLQEMCEKLKNRGEKSMDSEEVRKFIEKI
jgi:hypothetical protein